MSKRKICIVTSHKGSNYGSRLQATALYKYFENNGFEVLLLGKWRVFPQMIRHPELLLNRIRVVLNRKHEKKFFSMQPYVISAERENRLACYTNEIAKLKVVDYLTEEAWEKTVADDVCFVAGSDIIWNPAHGYPSKFFLDFAYCSGLKMFSYASSVGAPTLPKKYYRGYRRYLSKYSGVAVRESSAAKMLEPIIGRKVEHVVDPTLLMGADFWDTYAEQAKLSVDIDKKGFVLCYFVMEDDSYWEYVSKIQKATGLQIVVLPMQSSHERQPYTVILDGTPCEFLWLIKNAAFVCTDSFHACTISLVYKKEFYLLRRSRKSEDAKYDDLFTRYGLKERVVTDRSVFMRSPAIDYEQAHQRLREDQKRAYAYLDRMLEKVR